ncbi:macrophage mannose receptor 1-like isoform X2 [Mytilus trossulus]
MSWNDAENWCKSQTAHLVKFENTNERSWMMSRTTQILTQIKKPNYRFWTGLNNLDQSTSVYTWADGSPVSPLVTRGQAISPSSTNHCVKIDGNRLRNVNCNTKLAYICERHIGIPLTCNRDAGWQSFNNFCYKVFNRNTNNWNGAQTICNKLGGNIFTAESTAEEQIIHDFAKTTHKNYWIGIKAYQQGGSYAWLQLPNNTVVNPVFWARTPHLQRSQYNRTCAAVLYSRSSSDIAWQPVRCNARQNFVCKKAEGSCQPGWVAHQNRCYQFNTRYLLSWQQSMQFCRGQGARMVESYGNTATNFLKSYADELRSAGVGTYWIGATDNNTNTYKWSIGAAIKYQHWVHNPPTNTNNRQDCVYVSTNDRNGLWRPTPNCGTKRAFICTIGFNRPVKTITTPRPTLKCDARWTLNSGNCYQFNDAKRNWDSARQDCKNQGGDLATINTNRLHSFVINRIRTQEYWIGLNDKTQNRKFIWASTGLQTKFRKWCPREPNERGGQENCIEYKNQCWNDQGCSTGRKFVCQKPPKSIPLGPPITTTPMPFSLHCGVGWEEDPSSKYCYQFRDDQMSWNDARLACKRMGGDLASIHDRETQVYINTRSATMNSVALWLGGTDTSKEGGWTWSDRTPFNYVNWAPRQPDDARHNEDCMGYYVQQGHTWNDFPCNYRNGFICKKYWGPRTTIKPRPTPRVPAGQFLGCPFGWKKHANSCWAFIRKNMTATAARTECQRRGGYLATVNSRDEQNFIQANLPRPMKGLFLGGSYWIGLSDRVVENYFVWDDGTPVLYTNWNSKEPNNWRNMNEDCVSVWLQGRGWNDMPCNTVSQGYVCRKGVQVVATTGQNPLFQGCTNPWRGYGFGASCYALLDQNNAQRLTWQAAQASCQSKYKGQLATVNDRYVQSFLASYIDTRTDVFWIGLTDKSTPGTYSWIQGQTDYFTFWDNTHIGNEKNTCVAMRTTHPIGLWGNKQCTELHNYICETPRTGFTAPPSTIPPNVPCPTGWNQYSSYCYKKYSSAAQKLTWEASRDFCRGLGGDLLSIHDQNELNYIKTTLLIDDTTYWTGLNDRVNETGYVWSDGSGFDFTAWAPNEPNNFNNEDCGQIVGYTTQKGLWNDNNCYLSLNYICKIQRGTVLQTTAAPVTGVTSAQCGAGSWELFNGACYMTNPPDGANSSLSWYQAQQFCLANKANLASIHARDENNLLLGMTSKLNQDEFWIGLNELEKPGKYKWSDGSVLDFDSWNGNEPNDAFGGERCAGLLSSNGNWNDDNCNQQIGFICKKQVGSVGPVTPAPPQLISGGCSVNGFVPEPYGNKCFYANNNTTPTDWNSAVKFCRNFGNGYDIAAVNNEIEQAFLTSLIQGFTTNLWIGLNNLRHNNRFNWQDNSAFFYSNWNAGEPNGNSQRGLGRTEDCVEMYVKSVIAGSWNDQQCNTPRNILCQGPKAVGQATPSPQKNCRAGYVSHGTSCYKFVKTPVQSWQLAENFCQGDGGVLASINSNYENSFIESQMGPNFDYWIGLQFDQFKGTYHWQKSWPVTFTNWGYGEPSQAPSDRCVKSKNGLWDDTTCSLTLGYVCEINSAQPPIPTPAPPGHCRNPGEIINGDYCYYFSPFTYKDWPSARYACTRRLMDLVSITSQVDQDYVYMVMLNARSPTAQHTAQNIWVGLTKGINSGFMWSDNTAVSYTNWNAGEPSDPVNATNEECVEMYRDTGKWNDIPCDQKKSFVCKGRALLGAGTVPVTTLAPITPPNVGPVTQPNVGPATQPIVGPGSTSKPNVGPVTFPTFPNVFPTRNTPAPNKNNVPYVQPTGFINGPKNQAQTRVLSNKTGLSGGGLVGVLITVIVVLGVVAVVGMLFYKKRNPSPGGGVGGGAGSFDNALYYKGNEEVNINSSGDSGEADA